MGCGASLPGESTGPAPRFIGEELRAHCLASLGRGSSWAPAALDTLPLDKYGALIGDDAGAAADAVALRAGLLAKACVKPEELVGAASSAYFYYSLFLLYFLVKNMRNNFTAAH